MENRTSRRFQDVLPESQGQNLALTVLFVPTRSTAARVQGSECRIGILVLKYLGGILLGLGFGSTASNFDCENDSLLMVRVYGLGVRVDNARCRGCVGFAKRSSRRVPRLRVSTGLGLPLQGNVGVGGYRSDFRMREGLVAAPLCELEDVVLFPLRVRQQKSRPRKAIDASLSSAP